MLATLADIETALSDIYLRFSELFAPEDQQFWWRLAMEERGHASILESGIEAFVPMKVFPKELVDIKEDEAEKSLTAKRAFLLKISAPDCALSRLDALRYAAEVEDSDVEACFERLMRIVDPVSREYKLFQLLNKDSDEHAKRIRERIDLLEKNVPPEN